MKNTKKMLGALALSAALAFGCALPAFATEVGVGGGATKTGADSVKGDTAVNLFGYDKSTQIIATIPVDLTVSAEKDGGDLTCPTPAAYKITNGSDFAIKVSHADVKPGSADWQLSPAATTGKSGSTCQIYLALGNGVDAYGAANAPIAITGNSGADLPATIYTAAKGESIGIELSGTAHPSVNGSITSFDVTNAVKAATITYTVSK